MPGACFTILTRPDPQIRRFQSLAIDVQYERSEASTITDSVPEVGGEQHPGVLLERRDDAMVLAFSLGWAQRFQGEWVAVLTPDGRLRAGESVLRLRTRGPAGEIDVHGDEPGRDPLLERARWLGHAWLAWQRRFTVASTEEAIAALSEAHRRLPEVGWIARQRGLVHMGMQAFAAALADFDAALRSGTDAAADRARALLALARDAEALAALPPAGDDDPAYRAWVRGLVLRANHSLAAAAAEFRVALASPLDTSLLDEGRFLNVRMDARWQLGLTLAELGQHEEAITVLRNVPGPESHLARARSHEALGRIDEAIKRYECAATLGSAAASEHVARLRAASPARAKVTKR